MENPCALISELAARPVEEGWLEFKENEYDPTKLGTISALSNAAALAGLE